MVKLLASLVVLCLISITYARSGTLINREQIKYIKTQQFIQWFKNNHIVLLYFYSPNCEYCTITDPYIEELKNAGIKVYRININNHYKATSKWHIMGTPTTIAVDPIHHIAVPYQGFFNSIKLLLFYFYNQLIKIEKKRDLDNNT